MPPAYAALLLDLDGTLVDSEPKHCEAHRTFLATMGIQASDEVMFSNIGKGDRAFYAALMDRHGVTAEPDEWVRRKTESLMRSYRIDGLSLRPGARALLDAAFRDGLPCMVVTSAERRLCSLSLEVAGLAPRLPSRVCFEDTTKHKPDPAPYLLATRRLGVPPSRCLVIEDSAAGVRAGKAAGCTVVGFPGLVKREELFAAGADRCIASLEEALAAPAQPARMQARA
jgi:mannitol-1-/sugar-/sorbitol-6-phosphatase